ncbi:MAG: amino acid adenylation domain-containing protein [Caldilinea sp. CFX5]|nr:amino acid adenylation domain-containing protein [Caldilinea sp. CFX5]
MTTRKIIEIEGTLQALLATVLKIAPEDVAKSASFMNLGIDSMDALDLVQKLETVGFHGLPATLFFEYQTIADLARYLAKQPTTIAGSTPPPAPGAPGRQPVTRPGSLQTTDAAAATRPFQPLCNPIQRAFAINHRLYPERPAVAFLRQTIHGAIQIHLLQQAVQQVATRHPLLRTRFTVSNTADVLTPTICAPDEATIIPLIETAANSIGPGQLAQWEDAFVNRPFDLANGCPWRLALAADYDQPDQGQLLLAIHHMAGDAWSLSLVAHELWACYTALCQGRTFDRPMPPSPYHAQFAHQQPEPTALTWWRQQLVRGTPALPLRLPFDHDPETLLPDEWDKTRYAVHATRLTATQSAALTQLAADQNLSLFHLVLALYLRTLQQWTQTSNLIVNVADAQRPPHLPGIMAMVGSFADTLPLGLVVEPSEALFVLAERVRQNWLAIQQHKAVSSLDLVQILAEVAQTNEGSQPRQISPLGFSFARFEANPPVDCPVNILEIFGRTATPTMRLTLVGWEFAGELHFSWNYVTPLLQPATIAALAARFVDEITHLLGEQRPTPPTPDLNDAPNRERAAAPSSAKVEPVAPPHRTDLPGRLAHQPAPFTPVTALVQAQCERTPTAIAVWENGNALTYGELDRRAGQLAAAIHALNSEQAPVGLLAVPATAAVELLLGIARAGAAWVPLDPAHPPARHADQLAQAGARLLVFPMELAATAEAIKPAMTGAIQLFSLTDLLHRRGKIYLAPTMPEQIAYIIFTSGSTGRPKGAPITHEALANYIGWAVDTFGYGPADRVMQATSLCFDASIRQILAPLVTGGTVVPVARALLSDPLTLLHFLQEGHITIWSSVPALWARLVSALESTVTTGAPVPPLSDLRWIQVGGEALSAPLVRRWFDLMGDRQRIANLYGPTETTINATCYILSSRPAETETQIPIGYPIRGAQLQVCDENGQPCPAGAIGELWIGGVGLSPGYLYDPQRTAERFVVTPTGERFYRSGDRVQQQADGALRFLGRLDEQVKVRGYRIELGEIEATLSQHPAVRLAAVITRPANADEQMLLAYLECAGAPPTEESVRQWLQSRLPDYMLPHQFYATPHLPQMPNGKIDRQCLFNGAIETTPLPRTGQRSAPQTPTEQRLAQVWRAVLKLDSNDAFIAREDDFFALGGDSLRAIQLFVELGKVRPNLPRATYLYRYRTLAALAQALDAYQPAPSLPTATPAATDEPFGVSLAQAGFLLARALHAKQATTWCARFWLEGSLQIEHFQEAVQMLVARHAMLRAIFPTADGERPTRAPQQRILPPDRPLPVHFVDLQALTPAEQQSALAEQWQQLRNRPFDPTQWPLIAMHLCRLTPTDHLWLVATDHLIGDGLSGWLLGQELFQLYDALVAGQPPALPPLRSSFREYVALQQQREQQPDPASAQYWRQVFATPYQPPKRSEQGKTNDGAWVQHSIDLAATTVKQLEGKATAMGVTPYELLLTLFFRQLQRLTGQHDLIVGSALAGRDEPLPDIMRIFGAFATALPLRVQLAGESWEEQTQQVAQAFHLARAHTLSPRRIAQVMHPQTPLVAALGAQFLFSYMDFSTLGPLHSATLRVRWDASQTELQPPSQSADLVLTGRKLDDQLRLTFTAPAVAMSAQQMQTFADGFAQNLHDLTGDHQSQAMSPKNATPVAAPASTIHFSSRPLDDGTVGSGGARLDTALIGYLPPFAQIQPILEQIGMKLDANGVRRLLFPEQRPRWLELLATPLGHSGLIAIPRFADELATLPHGLLGQAIRQAIGAATTLGARCVSLAGMLPAHTRYGYALLEADENVTQPALTTGHSTTVVAVVKTVQAALTATQQDLSTLTVGCLGIGSIGSGALHLLLTTVGQPAALILCDLVGSGDRLRALAADLCQKFDYRGQVRIIEVDDRLPAELYMADLLIGAASRPNLLEVTRLAPGSIVVDDSFPACLDLDYAIERMRTAQDLLVVGGGLLTCGAVQRTLYLPFSQPMLAQQIAGQLHADAIASCQLEALLWSTCPDLPLTHGVATLAGALAYWQVAATKGITAAPLHLRDFRITESLLHHLKQIIRQRRLTKAP